MDLLIGVILGAILGVIVAAAFQRRLEHWFDRRGISMRRSWYRLRGKSIPVPQPDTFALAGRKLSFVVIDGDGEHTYTSDTLSCTVDQSALTFPIEIQARRAEIEAREDAKRAAGQSSQWNGPLFAVNRYALGRTVPHEELELRLVFQRTDYFAFQATVLSLDHRLPDGTTLRSKYLQQLPPDPVPFLAIGFGVAIVLLTKDEKIILSRRNHGSGARAGQLDITYVEGMHPELDLASTNSSPNLYTTAVRGAREEVGINITERDIHFLGFGVDLDYYQWNMLGFARVALTAAEALSQRSRGAGGKWEAREFLVVDAHPERVWQFLKNEKLWATGWVALYWSLVREYGRKRVDQYAASTLSDA